MKEKTVVTISRKWHEPQIKTTINNSFIKLEMSLTDFEEALFRELGSVALTLTKTQLKEKLHKAIEAVLQGIKEESAKVV